mgnify:CR=1 FL=1
MACVEAMFSQRLSQRPTLSQRLTSTYHGLLSTICQHNRNDQDIMSLSQAQKKALRSIGHHLNPVVTVSENGISEGVLAELDRALGDHELIKVKVGQGSDVDRKAGAAELAELSGSDLVGVIGRVWILYRPDPEAPRIDVG